MGDSTLYATGLAGLRETLARFERRETLEVLTRQQDAKISLLEEETALLQTRYENLLAFTEAQARLNEALRVALEAADDVQDRGWAKFQTGSTWFVIGAGVGATVTAILVTAAE